MNLRSTDFSQPISAENSIYLASLFRQNPDQVYYPMGRYSINLPEEPNYFKRYDFPTDIIALPPGRWSHQRRFFTVPKKLPDQGTCGDVYQIVNLIVLKSDDTFTLKPCSLIFKTAIGQINTRNIQDPAQIAVNEYFHASLTGDYMGIKMFEGIETISRRIIDRDRLLSVLYKAEFTPAIPSNIRTLYVMRCFNGKELFEVINIMDYMSDTACLKLINEMFREYELHVYRNHLIHCDIKPENARVVTDLTEIETFRWFDYGFSLIQGETRPFIRGSEEYTAPEIRSGHKSTTAADMYSFGKMLEFIYTNPDNGNEHFAAQADPITYENPAIQEIIKKMLDDNPINRPSILETSYFFQKHLSKKQISALNADIQEKATAAYDAAHEKLYIYNDPIYDHEYRQSQQPFNFKNFLDAFMALLDKIVDEEPPIIQQITQAFRSKILAGCESKEALLEKIDMFIVAFLDSFLRFIHRQDEVATCLSTHPEDVELQDLQRAMNNTLMKCQKATLFYDIACLSDKLRKQLSKFEPILSKHALLSEPPRCEKLHYAEIYPSVAECIVQYGIYKRAKIAIQEEQHATRLSLSNMRSPGM